jgi:hypothetical protein
LRHSHATTRVRNNSSKNIGLRKQILQNYALVTKTRPAVVA